MKLTTKTRYSVMAMVDLAGHGGGGPVSLADISERQCISLSYLEQLFSRLRRARLVRSVRGPGGGYVLACHSDEVSVCDIVRAVDEPISATRCGQKGARQEGGCVGGRACDTHELWDELENRIESFLGAVTLADVVAGTIPRLTEAVRDRTAPASGGATDRPADAAIPLAALGRDSEG